MPTQAVFFETPSNPMQSLVDIAAVCDLAHAAGRKGGAGQRLRDAAAAAGRCRSAPTSSSTPGTKHIDGQGRVLGGAILGDEEFIDGPVQKLMRHTGPSMSAFNAWVLPRALRRWPFGSSYQNASALRIAEFLEGHSAVRLGELPVPGVASAVRPGQAADVAAAARW